MPNTVGVPQRRWVVCQSNRKVLWGVKISHDACRFPHVPRAWRHLEYSNSCFQRLPSGNGILFIYLLFSHKSTFQLLDKPWSQVSSLLPLGFCLGVFIAHRVQQSHFSSSFHRVLLTHALALSASHFVHTKKFQRIYTSMHSGGFELTKLTHTRLEDNLIRHRGDRRLHATCCDFFVVHSAGKLDFNMATF